MAFEALALCVARSSEAIILNMHDQWVPIVHEDGCHMPGLSKPREIQIKFKTHIPDSNVGWANVCPTSGRQSRQWANVGPTFINVCDDIVHGIENVTQYTSDKI